MVDLTKLLSHAEPTRQAPGHRLARRSIHSVRAELDEQRSLKNQAKRQNIFSRLFASHSCFLKPKGGLQGPTEMIIAASKNHIFAAVHSVLWLSMHFCRDPW